MQPVRNLSRSIRFARIQHALHKSSDGLTSRELAEICGVTVRTIQRDLLDMQSYLGVPLTQNDDRYGIVKEYALPPIFLSVYEATALFLACRLALRLGNENNPHMRQALAKISTAMPQELAGLLRLAIGDHEEDSNSDFSKVFEAVSLGWITRRRVKILYLPLTTNQLMDLVLEPYFVEMIGAGHATYVIGHARSEEIEGILSFNLGRIKRADVLSGAFDPPSEQDLGRIISSAWGTMWRENTETRFWSDLAEGVRQMTLHISSWLEPHLSIKRASEMPVGEQLSETSLARCFDEHARRSWQSITQPNTESETNG